MAHQDVLMHERRVEASPSLAEVYAETPDGAIESGWNVREEYQTENGVGMTVLEKVVTDENGESQVVQMLTTSVEHHLLQAERRGDIGTRNSRMLGHAALSVLFSTHGSSSN